jgi:hypothetical protein
MCPRRRGKSTMTGGRMGEKKESQVGPTISTHEKML